jgi:pyruvate/2-oxoglutarate dehydrogenase complex dihydrolipoamide dehydrogenase (E3) component
VSNTDVDVVVLGLGVGGEEVGGKLAAAGLSVVGIERRLVGGECPYWGCIPSKMMIRASNALAEARRVNELAGHTVVTPDWAPVAKRIRDEATDNWDDAVAVKRFTDKGGQFVRGSGHLTSGNTVEVGDETYRASRGIVLNLGTSASIPPIDGLAGTPFWTNKEMIEVTELPRSLVVLGGGAIGLELAQVFARFGVDVTIVEALDRLLALEEPESSQAAAEALQRDGVTIKVGAKAERVSHDGSGFTVHLAGGHRVSGEKLLVATGRRVNTAGVGLENAGLDPKARAIEVDERLRADSGVGDKIWAVGDVTGKGAFTHVAMYQAGIVIRDILGQDGPPADYKALPRVTFTDPEIGAVGMTESQAREKGLRIRTAVSPIPESARGWIHKIGNEGFIKLVCDADRDVLVGATSTGPTGGEVLSGLAVAVHAEVSIATLRSMIYAYPTFHRAIENALSRLA